MSIDILVVAFHAKTELTQALCSLALWSSPGYRLTVYDNAPINYSLTWLWNRFIERSKRDVIALVNADVIVSPGWDTEALALFEEYEDCPIAMPVSNYVFHSALANIPSPDETWPESVPKLVDHLKENQSRFHLSGDHAFVSGHCMLVRRWIWERLGGFNENFPFLNNDWEFNQRVIAANLKLGVCLHAAALHWGSSSTKDAEKKGLFKHGQQFVTPPKGVTFEDV